MREENGGELRTTAHVAQMMPPFLPVSDNLHEDEAAQRTSSSVSNCNAGWTQTTSPCDAQAVEARQPIAIAPFIETPRLQLRMLAMDDLDDLARIFSQPEVMKFLGTRGEPLSRAETGTALASIIEHWRRNKFGRWAVVHKEHGKLIGYGGLRSFDNIAELVYLLDRPYWGQGLATEIARASLRYGFVKRRFDPIIALAKPLNLASRRVMEKAGMKFEKEANYFNIDVVQYNLTLDEYERLNASPGSESR